MKSVITAICLLISLVIIFVIISRKDFYSNNDVVVQETVTMTNNTSIVETEPKPTDATAVKSVENKKDAPIPPTHSHTRTVIAETKTSVDEKPAPAAVPVATTNEAKLLNEEALDYVNAKMEKLEPFYKLYEGQKIETFSVQGTIRAVSEIPDPALNDYPNCLYTVFVELDSILSDTSADHQMPYEVILNIPVMKDKEISKERVFFPGDQIVCMCAEYDSMPQGIQEIQLSDDIQSFEHQQYYALRINKVSAFSTDGKKDFAKREIRILPIRSLPKDEKVIELRRKRIQSEIERIEEELKKHGGSFAAWKEEYKPIGEKYKKLCDEEYKGWINDSYFSATGKESTYNTKAYIEWILPYKQYLEKNNIDLIVLRYPSRSDFAARVLAADVFQENPAWVEHYYNCLKNDIDIVDPMPEMWRHRFDYPLFYFYGHARDIHPLEGELKTAAKVISDILQERYCNILKKDSFSLQKVFIDNNELYVYPEGHPSYSSTQPIEFDGVTRQNKSMSFLSVNSGSPILFLSSSLFGYREMQAVGASVPHYLCFYLQSLMDWKYQSGVENSMLRNLISSSEILNNRRAVVMVGRYDSWNGGPVFPKYYLEDIDRISFGTRHNFFSPDITVINDSCKTNIDDDGSLSVLRDQQLNSAGDISVKINIQISPPSTSGCKTCMMRVNLKDKNNKIMIRSYVDSKMIDYVELSNIILDKTDLYADLLIPLSKDMSPVQISLSSRKRFAVSDIELWYY